ncbi:MAG TPA: hypothetical protein VJ201_03575 [Candidatus Babeliales bacterium]|nr:hypothetical protein [Candidatus Babeliales bacterium]
MKIKLQNLSILFLVLTVSMTLSNKGMEKRKFNYQQKTARFQDGEFQEQVPTGSTNSDSDQVDEQENNADAQLKFLIPDTKLPEIITDQAVSSSENKPSEKGLQNSITRSKKQYWIDKHPILEFFILWSAFNVILIPAFIFGIKKIFPNG